jgi:signal transduction histidine kinase
MRLLMILEWVLLGMVAIAQVLLAIFKAIPLSLLINGLGLGLFAVLGLITPQRKGAKLLYTLTEFVLILGLTFLGHIPLPVMLFIVLVMRNCVLWDGKIRTIITVLAFCGCFVVQTDRLLDQNLPVKIPLDQLGPVWLAFLLILGLVILFLHLLVDAALKEHQGQEKLAAANNRLRQYALRVEELAIEQERSRIARDIHDSLGHSLTVYGIHIEAALRLMHSNPAKAEALLLEVKQLNSQTLQEVRQSVSALRSDPLQGKLLTQAIADLVTEFQRSTEILPNWQVQVDVNLSKELSVTIYRIVQESLTNIYKYAAATEVSITIVQLADQLKVSIQDNGTGFDANQNTTGFGLQGMQERTLALAGQLEILTAPNQGCAVKAMFPIQANVAQ